MNGVKWQRVSAYAMVAIVPLLLVAATATEGAEKTIVMDSGRVELSSALSFAPTSLPKRESSPVSLTTEGSIRPTAEIEPIGFDRLQVEVDKNATLNLGGRPVCRVAALESWSSAEAEDACRPAMIGRGSATILVLFPGGPYSTDSKVLLFNGGKIDGAPTLLVHASFDVPSPQIVVAEIKVMRISNGPYGLKFLIRVPEMLEGHALVESFELKIDRSRRSQRNWRHH